MHRATSIDDEDDVLWNAGQSSWSKVMDKVAVWFLGGGEKKVWSLEGWWRLLRWDVLIKELVSSALFTGTVPWCVPGCHPWRPHNESPDLRSNRHLRRPHKWSAAPLLGGNIPPTKTERTTQIWWGDEIVKNSLLLCSSEIRYLFCVCIRVALHSVPGILYLIFTFYGTDGSKVRAV